MIWVLLLITPVSVILNGFVLSQFWVWYVVPLGVTSISIAHAIGLSMLVKLFLLGFKSEFSDTKTDDKDMLAKSISLGIFAPVLVLGLGWFVHLFM